MIKEWFVFCIVTLFNSTQILYIEDNNTLHTKDNCVTEATSAPKILGEGMLARGIPVTKVRCGCIDLETAVENGIIRDGRDTDTRPTKPNNDI